MTTQRILVAGGPRVGKTTLADRLAAEMGITARHTDSLIGLCGWSEASAEVAKWIEEPGPWVIEGVAVGRAIRKFVLNHPDDAPCDVVFWSMEARTPLTKGQDAMGKGCRTVWDEIRPALRAHGVVMRSF